MCQRYFFGHLLSGSANGTRIGKRIFTNYPCKSVMIRFIRVLSLLIDTICQQKKLRKINECNKQLILLLYFTHKTQSLNKNQLWH